MDRSIKIVPLINPPPFIIDEIKHNFEETFNLPVITLNIINIPDSYKNSLRNQYRVSKIFSYLKEICPDDSLKIIGVISEDIYEEGYNFLFGSAELNGKYSIISIYRLYDENESLFKKRVVKEAIHELGHTFGLNHCDNKICVMNFSLSINDVDKKDKHFCKLCENKLRIALKNI